ncbi:MAG: AraC family transcriptional regulator [Treponema sp.]|nr:helix-turn-helix domain-containing protein [Treponema sp.]MCR4632392.1 AraC family transcriptional regulator [Treponema sp.]
MDSKEKILSHKLFLQQEDANFHSPFDNEMSFYDAVKNGDFENIKRHMNPLNAEGMGKLSSNPLRNAKYHLIVTIALITRFCIEGGMPSESAYTLSDIYIQELDACNSFDEVSAIHREVIYDFTERMQKIRKKAGFSKIVIQATDYIYNHLNEKIQLDVLAKYLDVSKSYLCELFKKETGITVYTYITKLKIEASCNMLMNSDYTPAMIGNYFAFSSHSHFISKFKAYTGLTPNQYRKAHYRNFFEVKEEMK